MAARHFYPTVITIRRVKGSEQTYSKVKYVRFGIR